MLKSKIDNIISKYRIDAIFYVDGFFFNINEIYEQFKKKIVLEARKNHCTREIVIYPAGAFGREITDILLENDIKVKYLIDNKCFGSNYKNIPIISYEEWLEIENQEYIYLCSLNNNEQFYQQIVLDDLEDRIINVGKRMLSAYPYMDKHTFNELTDFGFEMLFTYEFLNKLECNLINENYINRELFKILIYGLLIIRDFYYAKIYIDKYTDVFADVSYKNAISEIESVLKTEFNGVEFDNIMIIHIVDSLRDSAIENMPFLSKLSKEGLRISGITTQYPCTHYVLNTMFTGRSTFDIDQNGEELQYKDSEFLRYIEKNMMFSIATCNKHLMEEFKEINSNRDSKYYHLGITRILFEGLCLVKKNPKNHVIVLHSSGEAHDPFYRVGYEKILIKMSENITFDEIKIQSDKGLDYIDRELEWYLQFFNKSGIINIIQGDHGIDISGNYNYFHGIKKDMPRCSKEATNTAFVASGVNKKFIKGKISIIKESNILFAILQGKIDQVESYCEEYTFLQQPPGYANAFVDRFIVRGIYSQYEGFIGVDLDEELFLLSATGREQYFRPKEFGYRNLIKHPNYKERIEYCKSLLEYKEYPIEIYASEKYQYHLEVLKKYRKQEYQIIKNRLEQECGILLS